MSAVTDNTNIFNDSPQAPINAQNDSTGSDPTSSTQSNASETGQQTTEIAPKTVASIGPSAPKIGPSIGPSAPKIGPSIGPSAPKIGPSIGPSSYSTSPFVATSPYSSTSNYYARPVTTTSQTTYSAPPVYNNYNSRPPVTPATPASNNLKQIRLWELKEHNTSSSLWIGYKGYVYDATDYKHSGGPSALLRGAGKDATKMITMQHSWVKVDEVLRTKKIGVLVDQADDEDSD